MCELVGGEVSDQQVGRVVVLPVVRDLKHQRMHAAEDVRRSRRFRRHREDLKVVPVAPEPDGRHGAEDHRRHDAPRPRSRERGHQARKVVVAQPGIDVSVGELALVVEAQHERVSPVVAVPDHVVVRRHGLLKMAPKHLQRVGEPEVVFGEYLPELIEAVGHEPIVHVTQAASPDRGLHQAEITPTTIRAGLVQLWKEVLTSRLVSSVVGSGRRRARLVR